MFYSSPPPARTFHDDKATLLVCWWCTIFAAVIILFRVCGRYVRSERLFREDWLAFSCLIPLLARMGFLHVVLLFGTNNAIVTGLSEEDIRRRSIGSRLVLAERIFYAGTLWMLKLTITGFFKRLTANIWTSSHERMLVLIRWFLFVSFMGVIITDLVECHPITHYWQVVPDPGPRCRQGLAQLMMMGIANIVSDVLLVAFPLPIIIRSQMPLTRKIQLGFLFAGSLIPAGTTIYRLPNVIDRHGSQQYRSLLASIEILFATAVANALILGSFVRDKGVKKHRYKFGSTSDSLERTSSRRGTVVRYWGSDEDLVRDLGISVTPELRDPESLEARPAPMATAGNVPVKAHRIIGEEWHFPGERSDTSDETDLMKMESNSKATSSMVTPRRVSFFDVGGLLDDDRPRRQSSTRTMASDGGSSSFGALASIPSHDGLSPPPPPRRASSATQDTSMYSRYKKPQPYRDYELQTILREDPDHEPDMPRHTPRTFRSPSLQDVGGLLSR